MTRNYKSEAPSILSEFLFQRKILVKEVLVTLHSDDLIEAGNTSSRGRLVALVTSALRGAVSPVTIIQRGAVLPSTSFKTSRNI